MRLCYNAGAEAERDRPRWASGLWDEWWEKYGKDRHDELMARAGAGPLDDEPE